jgi:hypothetical protein
MLEYGDIGPWIFLCMYSFSMFSQLIFLLFVILNEDTNSIKCILFTLDTASTSYVHVHVYIYYGALRIFLVLFILYLSYPSLSLKNAY